MLVVIGVWSRWLFTVLARPQQWAAINDRMHAFVLRHRLLTPGASAWFKRLERGPVLPVVLVATLLLAMLNLWLCVFICFLPALR
jgi:hypothetical protein